VAKALIVNVDDFGLTSGVNAAVEELFVAGSVTSATLLVAGDAVSEAAAIAKRHPRLGVGLHFNLTLGRPCAPPGEVSSIVDSDGRLFPRKRLVARAIRGQVEPDDVRRELAAQVDAFHSLGVEMSHVDSHQHAHVVPRVFDAVAEFCEQRRLPLRMPRVWIPDGGRPTLKRSLTRLLLGWRLDGLDQKWSSRLVTNNTFASVFDSVMTAAAVTGEVYRNILAAGLDGPLELMVHPAIVDRQLEGLTRITAYSEAEFRVLRTLDLGQIAAEFGYRPSTYSDAFAEA
jgi:predicted glycoside hydrolase/deacetylase ChbG (UPF0249 family)